jgi:DNA-directed RNA polymerase sigma subunit (sigma70/sigma32)
VLVGRYGLFGAEPRSPCALAAERGVTPEWVRQLQFHAERRLLLYTAMDTARAFVGE